MPINEVEDMDITDYRLCLFTIFNDVALHSMDPKGFKFMTDEEEAEEITMLADEAIKQGYDL